MSLSSRTALIAFVVALAGHPAVSAEGPYFRFRALGNGMAPNPGQAGGLTATVPGLTVRQGRSISHGPGTPTGGTSPYSWTLQSGPLPAGTTLLDAGVISGVASAAGSWPGIVLALSDAEGRKGLTNAFSIDVLATPTLAYRSVKVRPGRAIAIPPQPGNLLGMPTYALSSGSLPTGLRLDPDGVIRGALQGTAGSGPIAVTLRDTDGEPAASPAFSIEAAATDPLLTGRDLDLNVGQDFQQALVAEGFATAPRHQLVSGRLPAGVSLDAERGVLYGKPTVPGTFEGLVVTATAQDGTAASTEPFAIRVSAVGVDNPGALRARLYQTYDRRISSRGLAGGTTWHSTGASLPPGMSISPDGRVTGVPTRVGTYPDLDATASNGATAASTGAFSVEVYSDSLYVGMADIKARAGSTVTRAATLDPAGTAATYALSGPLPSGLALDTATGAISGTPTVPGSASNLRLSATSGSLTGTSAPFAVTVVQALEASARPVGGIVGARVSHALSADGLIGAATWRLVSGTLPDGLSLGSDGVISGTPTRAMSVSGLVARVTDSGDGSAADTAPFTAQVAASDRMLVTGLSGVYGTRLNRPLALPRPIVQNAVGTPMFAIEGALPSGLSIDAATGAVSSGQNPVTQTGNGEPLAIVATDSRPSTASSPSFAVRLVGPLGLAGTGSIAVRAGDLVDMPVAATNLIGEPAYSLSVPTGADPLPPGLFFSEATGRIYGRPLAEATLRGVRIALRDGADGEVATSDPFDVTVSPGIVVDGPASLQARVGLAFDSADQFSARGAQDGLSWFHSGSLPPGLGLDPVTGRITGTPTQEGTATGLGLIARQGRTGISGESRPFSIEVSGPLTVNASRMSGIRVNEPASVAAVAVNGVGTVSWALERGAPPAGMGFDAQTGRIYGVPSVQASYGPIVFKARDSIGQEALSQPVTIQVGDQLRISQAESRYETRLKRDVGTLNPTVVTGATGDWSVAWSEVPPGLAAARDGTLTGSTASAEPYSKFLTATVTDSAGATATSNYFFYIAYWDKPYLTGFVTYDQRQVRKSSVGAFAGKPMMFSAKGYFPFYTGIISNDLKHYEFAPGGRRPAWATLDRKTGDLSGTPPAAGEYHADVVLVDDTDGARSDPHDYEIIVRDLTASPPTGNYVVRSRTGTTTVDPVFQKVFPAASFTNRPSNWCRTNFASSTLAGLVEAGYSDCSVILYNFRNTIVGAWDDLWMEAVDDDGVTRRVNLSIHVAPPLKVTAPADACSRGAPVSVAPKAVGGLVGTPTYLTRSDGNPTGPDEGFTFDATTGTLTGKPLQISTRYGYRIGVRDGWDGSEAWSDYFRGELRNPLYMRFFGPYDRYVGDSDSYLSPNTNGTAPYGETRAFSADSAPPGIRFTQYRDNDGYFAGTYSAPGTYDVRVRLQAACTEGTVAEDVVRFNVRQRVWPAKPEDMTATEGVAFSSRAPAVTYATLPMRWELRCCGPLPAGLAVDAPTGRIVGTPAAGSAGSYPVELSVTDQKGTATSGPFKVTVKPSPAVNYPDRSAGRVGKPLVAAPTPLGATGPLLFAFAPGSPVPSDGGLALDPGTGEIVGTPTRTGVTEGIRVVMTEASGGSSTSNPFALDVSPGVAASIPADLRGKVGEAFLQRATATGNVGAIIWSMTEGRLPDGIDLDPSTGSLAGTPLVKGTYGPIRLTASDSAGGTGVTEPFTLAVAEGTPPPATLTIACDPATTGPSGSGAPADGPSAEQSCALGLWGEGTATPGQYVQAYGSVGLVDPEGAASRSLGADYSSVKVVDIETAREHEVGRNRFQDVFQATVTGTGSFSRRYQAVARLASGQVRTSAPFTLHGSYGRIEPTPARQSWTWGDTVCVTPCPTGVGCEARQLQSCQGAACPTAATRSCQVPSSSTGVSVYKAKDDAGDTCVNPLLPPDERQCFTDRPVDRVRFDPYWTVSINGVKATVYRHPDGFSAPVRPTAGLLESLGVPYTTEPVTASMWQFGVTGGSSGVATIQQDVQALIVDRAGARRVYDAMNRYAPRDIVVGVDGPVLIVAAGDASPIAAAVDGMSPGSSTIRGAGPYSIWHCIGSLCTVRLKAK